MSVRARAITSNVPVTSTLTRAGRFVPGWSLGSISLAAVMVLWPQAFLFSKIAPPGSLDSALPAPFLFPALLATICLVPAALVPATLKQATFAATGASATASAILVIASLHRWQESYILANAAFNFAWALFPCVASVSILLALRLVARKLSIGGSSRARAASPDTSGGI